MKLLHTLMVVSLGLFVFLVSCDMFEPIEPQESVSALTIVASPDRVLRVNEEAVLTVALSDSADVKIYWSQDSSAFVEGVDSFIVSYAEVGEYQVFVKCSKSDTLWSKIDTIAITVSNSLPTITPLSDTVLSADSVLILNLQASDSDGIITQYLWDTNGDGVWDDSTGSSGYALSKRTGYLNSVIIGVEDNSGLRVYDTITIRFNRPPSSVSFPSMIISNTITWSVDDPDSVSDSLNYTLFMGLDSTNLSEVYSGQESEISQILSYDVGYFYKLVAVDGFGDSLVHTGSFVKTGMKLIPAMGKTFEMGIKMPSGYEDPIWIDSIAPLHAVTVTYNYYMDSTEVTQGKFHEVMGQHEKYIQPIWDTVGLFSQGYGNENPAFNISWYSAILYCNELSKLHGKDTVYSYTDIGGVMGDSTFEVYGLQTDFESTGYRLPTEAEWEFACKGGKTTNYYWADKGRDYPFDIDSSLEFEKEIINQHAVWRNNSEDYGDSSMEYGPHIVARKIPNDYGLYDMIGNVNEMCGDWYSNLNSSTETNPTGPQFPVLDEGEAGCNKVVKGGSWVGAYFREIDLFLFCSGGRVPLNVYEQGEYLGFRVVCRAN